MLIIAVAVVYFIYFTVYSNLNSSEDTIVDLVGKIESGDLIIEHNGGENLGLETKALITIGGREVEFIVGDYLDNSAKVDNKWNIGEEVIYPSSEFSDIEELMIDIKSVVDIETNSMVLYGLIQPGDIIPYEGKGAIWLFDEGIGSIAFDSSGNNNHGTIIDGKYSSSTSVLNTSLYFDGVNDYVLVENSFSLTMTEEITIEAWMKPSPDILLSEIELDANFGYNPRILHIYDEIYAVVYQGFDVGGGDGYLKTFEIDINGDINETEIDELIFGNGDPSELESKIIHINGNIYGIVYKNKNDEATLKTIEILSNGTIDDTIIDSFILDTNDPNEEPDIIHVSDDIFAVTYKDKNFAKLHTVQISPNGVINGTIDKVTFDNAWCEDSELIHVNGDIFAIAYIKNPNQVTVRTVEILSDGTITSVPANYIDELIIENDGTDDPNIIHVIGSVYAVIYSVDNSNSGDIATFVIENNGMISNNIIDSFRFEENKCDDPNIIHHGDDVYLVAYTSNLPHVGYVISLHIQPDGNITDSISPYYIYSEDQGYEPQMIHIDGNVYAIVYRGWSPHTGHLGTINPYKLDDPINNGIVKSGVFSIYSNATRIFGTINDAILSNPISSGWMHVVLTYDGMEIKLYLDGVLANSTPKPGTLNTNSNDIRLGYLYHGYIDEVYIYENSLSNSEILDIYNKY